MSDNKNVIVILILLAVVAGCSIAPLAGAQSSSQTMLQNLASHPEFSSIVNLAKASGLDGALNGGTPYTLFAPTNSALSSLPSDRVNALLNNKPLLANLVQYHVVPGKVAYSDLARMTSIKTVDGRTLPVTVKNGVVSVAGTKIEPNSGIDSKNGMIYPINSVMMPPGFALPQAAPAATQVSQSGGLPWWVAPLVGALILGGLLLWGLSRGRKHKTYERGYEAARARPEEHYKAEDTMQRVRESLASVKEPTVADIAKNVELPLSGDALTGLNELLKKGTFSNKQDFIGFLAKQYFQNNLGAAMAGGSEPGVSTILDIINKTGIAKGFLEGDVKKYLVPLLMTGFMAIYKYLTKQPAVKPV